MSELRLDYVALAVRDCEALRAMLTGPLGLELYDVPAAGAAVSGVSIGNVSLLLLDIDDGRLEGPAVCGLHHLGLACDDPLATIASSGLDSHGAIEDGFGGNQLAFGPESCAGVRLRMGSPLGRPAPGGSEVVERLDHVGVASADNRGAERVFATRLGFDVESRQTDMEVRTTVESFTSDRYGVVHQARPPEAVGGLRVSFITVGDCELELLEEFDPAAMSESRRLQLGHMPGTTRQDQGAIGRFVERRGPGLHHLAIKTPDIDDVLGRLAAAGLRTIDRTGRPGSRRARIGFVHPAASGGIVIHFVERDPV